MLRSLSLAVSALAVAAGMGLSPAPAEAQQGNAVTCRSMRFEADRVYCGADVRRGVRLSRQYSEAPCVEGRSWGTAARSIWVSHGCRAEFIVGGGQTAAAAGDGNRDRSDDARDERRAVLAMRERAERACHGIVVDRLRNAYGSDVRTDYVGRSRRGAYMVSWRTSSAAGNCWVTDQGRLVRFDRTPG